MPAPRRSLPAQPRGGKVKTYTEIEDWFQDQDRLINNAWDNVHLVTGEEGTGKSLWMRKCARRMDPAFTIDRIHFTQDDCLTDVANLPVGSSVVLDEFRGHRRLAMHGDRMEFLDFLKECRAQGLNLWIGYPHVSQFERDILNNRIRWWEHKPSRGLVEIRKRVSNLVFDKTGEPKVSTKWPLVGRFPVTDQNDPLRPAYDAKKDARMRDRAARYKEAHGKGLEAAPIEPRRADAAAQARINMSLVELAQKELGAVG